MKVVFVLTSLLASAAVCNGGPVVSLRKGDVEGSVEGFVAAWRGIPFAAPPVGDNRWRPPKPVQTWKPRVLKAMAYKPECPQFEAYGMFGPNLTNNSDEDCLYLNVWAPFPLPNKAVAVLAWLHGGAFIGGSATNAMYDGASMVNFTHDHIMVSIAYRLGVLGFAASDLLRLRDPEGSTGNYAFQDQRQGLRWIQDNIASFGGDPSRVLLFGESAGGVSVSNHLVRPKSWGLFHAALVQSGSFLTPLLGGQQTVHDQNRRFETMMHDLQCSNVQCLVERPFLDLMKWQPHGAAKLQGWLPVVDGVEIAEVAAILAKEGKLAQVPVIVGTNEEDASVSAIVPECRPASCTEADFRKWARTCFGVGGPVNYSMSDFDIDRLTALYSNEPGRPWNPTATKWYWAIKRAGGDQLNGCSARRFARWITAAKQAVFWYHFTATSKSMAKDGFEGYPGLYSRDSCEGCEMPYVFGNRLAKSEQALSRVIQGYWLSFAAGLKPAGRTAWPPFNLQDEPALTLGQDVRVRHHPLHEKCGFWDGFFSNDWHPVSPRHQETKFMVEAQQNDRLEHLRDHLQNNSSITGIMFIFCLLILSAYRCLHPAVHAFKYGTVAPTGEHHKVADDRDEYRYSQL